MAKTDKTVLSDVELEAFFEAGRTETPEPGPELMARILADADAEIAAQHPRPSPVAGRARRQSGGFWAALGEAVGGWPALAGMATAAVAGVWFGFAAPTSLAALTDGLGLLGTSDSELVYELEDLLPGYTGFESLSEEVQG